MASVLSTAPRPPGITPTRTARSSGWPERSSLRLLIALVFATPYLALAWRAYSRGYSDSANAVLARRSDLIHWGSSNLSFVGHVYPPLPTAIASLLPNATALGCVGALAAGAMLEAVASRLSARGYPLWAAILLPVLLGASPSFALTATTNLAAFMALLFLALALDGFLRFVFLGQTHGGFQAGLTIGIAGLCDPTAVICAIGFAAAAPLIARNRYRGQRHAGRATAAVLLFPTLAGIAGWIFLCWRFTGSPLGWLRTAAPGVWTYGGSWSGLSTALTQSFKPVLLTPVFVLAVVLLLVARRPIQAAGICLPLVAVILAKWIGLSFSGLSIAIVLGIVGVVSLPAAPRRRILAAIVVVALLGVVAKWTYPPSPAVLAWEHTLRLR